LRVRSEVLAGAAALVLAPVVLSNFSDYLLAWALVSGIAFLGLVVVTGLGGQISLCQASFMGFGAFFTALLIRHDWSFWLAWPASALLAVPIGIVVGLPAMRLRGVHLGVATLGFAVFFNEVVFRWSWLTGGSDAGVNFERPSLFGFELDSNTRYYGLVLVVFAVAAALTVQLQRSVLGRSLRAMRDAERGAMATGLSIERAKLLAFALSAVYGAVAGGLLGPLLGTVVRRSFDPISSVVMLALAGVAGLASVPGAVIAGLLLNFLPGQIGTVGGIENVDLIIPAVLLIILMQFAPDGLAALPRHIVRLTGAARQPRPVRAEEAVP
jgi:branched-chain amino acid transport system permease protein